MDASFQSAKRHPMSPVLHQQRSNILLTAPDESRLHHATPLNEGTGRQLGSVPVLDCSEAIKTWPRAPAGRLRAPLSAAEGVDPGRLQGCIWGGVQGEEALRDTGGSRGQQRTATYSSKFSDPSDQVAADLVDQYVRRSSLPMRCGSARPPLSMLAARWSASFPPCCRRIAIVLSA